ncbi:hypothetical protein Patl1_30179 [Pistacia atlantica]|uniref:Uncharacterized protein n=1 Tax=Pistacia atlantica TaxID=434234 RepID=A0ACC1ACU1_9ROSI|nr:hypothetical protein Patl1_30179 [Pistacia atlantica]
MHCPVFFFFFILVFWVGQLRETSNKVHNAELKLFLEVERGLDLRPIAPPGKTKEDILLFFKLYDPEKEQLCYVGRLFVKSTGNPMEYLAKLEKWLAMILMKKSNSMRFVSCCLSFMRSLK